MATNRDGLVQQLDQWLRSHGISTQAVFVAGVSGGMDSMVLAECLHRAGVTMHVAHVNYHLRGAASDEDQALVEHWCEAREIPCHVHHADMESTPGGLQATARRKRYAHFEAIRAEVARATAQPAYTAVAHHADDQAETVLLHLIRSADPLALASMQPVDAQRHIIRPFLTTTRAHLARTAEAWGVAFREDASNAKPDYLRNRIRHEVMPLLEELRTGTTGHVAQWAERFGGLRALVNQEIEDARHRCWKEGVLDLVRWREEPLGIELMHRLAQDHGIASKAVPEVAALAEATVESGAFFASAVARVERRGQTLLWSALT